MDGYIHIYSPATLSIQSNAPNRGCPPSYMVR